MSRIGRVGMSLIVAVLAMTAFNVSTAMARHQWSNYHWEFPTGATQLTININNCQVVPIPYSYGYNTNDHFSGPNTDWHNVINASTGAIALMDNPCPGLTAPADPIGTFDARALGYELYDATNATGEGTVNAFNDNYGDTGWVGVAIVELTQSSGDNHIVYGEVHLNDYYPANFGIYDNAGVMRKVQCQEVGHIFGLDHIKKDTSCMYSSAIFLGNAHNLCKSCAIVQRLRGTFREQRVP